MKKVSISELVTFDKCMRAYYLERILKIKGSPYLPFIIGNSVHHFVSKILHQENPEGRTFYFKTKESALDYFKKYWDDEVWPIYGEYFDNENRDLKWRARSKAIENLDSYMALAKNRGIPEMEISLTIPVTELGCQLTGVIDQKRPTNPEWAERNGLEKGGYVLVDLKTGKSSSNGFSQKDQISLDNNIQATMYYFLAKKVYGVKPDAFVFWFLGGNKPEVRTTFRDDVDEEELFSKIRSFLNIIKENTSKIFKSDKDLEKYWPKTSNTYECKFCQYWNSCWKAERTLLTTIMNTNVSSQPFGVSETQIKKVGPTQMEFRYKNTRRKIMNQNEKEKLEKEKYQKLMLEKNSTNPS